MRLGRTAAILSVGAALAATSGPLASPALAYDNSTDGFTVHIGSQALDPASTSVVLNGSGCSNEFSKTTDPDKKEYAPQVRVSLLHNGQSGLQDVSASTRPDPDGNWSTELNIAEMVTAHGGDVNEDGWTLSVGCYGYNDPTRAVSVPIYFDNTHVTGTYTIEGASVGAQSFNVEGNGFTPGETVSVSLVDTTDESVTYQVGTLTVDAEGKVLGSLAAPGGVPDGRYKLVLTGSRYGESAASLTLIKVSGGLFSFANGAGDGNMAAASKDDDPGVPSAQPASGTKKPGGSDLARTGVDATLALGAAVLVGVGAVTVARRRRA